MKKLLVALGMMMTMFIAAQASFAACPCTTTSSPCPVATPCPCEEAMPCPSCCNKCTEEWLSNLESYYCKIGLNDCQKDQARRAVNQFLCDTKNLNNRDCNCKESKCDCRAYKRALKNLDCEMKQIITKCQKADYKCVRNEIKAQVKCCHKCLIWPFSRCSCNKCDAKPCKQCCK